MIGDRADARPAAAGPAYYVHAFQHFPRGVASSATSCGTSGIRGDRGMVDCPDCLIAPDYGDFVVGTAVAGNRCVVGIVVGKSPAPQGFKGFRYDVQLAALWPTGEVATVEVYGGVTVVARSDSPVDCPACLGVHNSPRRLVDCLVAHVRARSEAQAVDAARVIDVDVIDEPGVA